jgi:hypothetical protein
MQHKILNLFGITILLIGVYAAPSYAGGSSWEVLVERVETHSQTSATIYLKQMDIEKSWHPKCSILTILAEYRPENQAWSKSLVTQAKHVKALDYLKQAHIEGKKIRFGEVGTGLVSQQTSDDWFYKLRNLFSFWNSNEVNKTDIVSEQTCTFKTKRLDIVTEYNGRLAVYSFYYS